MEHYAYTVWPLTHSQMKKVRILARSTTQTYAIKKPLGKVLQDPAVFFLAI